MKTIFSLLLALFALTLPARAAELPREVADVLPQELLAPFEQGDGEGLSAGMEYLASRLREALREALFPSLRAAASLMLLGLLCGLVEGTAGSAGELPTRYTAYVGVLGASMLSAGDVHSLLVLGEETVEELSTLAHLLLPTVAAAMASGGAVGSAGVWQSGALLLSDAFLTALRELFVPLIYCMLGVAAAGALLPQSRLALLAEGMKKLLSIALSALLLAFTGFLSLSNILSGSADRVAVQLGKTVVSGAVPIVGSILSDATETLLAGAHALRGTLGTLGILAVLALCLAPLVRLGVQYLLYRAAAFFCAMTGAETLSAFLQQISSAFSLMLALTAGAAFLLLASLLISLLMVVMV